MKPRFDKLFAAVVRPGETPERLVMKLSVEGNRGFSRPLSAFRKLRQDARLRAAQSYLLRFPPPKSVEEDMKIRAAKEHRIFKAFLHDQNGPSSSFYDASPCMYVARQDAKDEAKVYWEARHPFHLRIGLPYPFKSPREILAALIRLAARLGCAFRVDGKSPVTGTRYGVVLMPEGDRRAESLASKPENAHECEGLPFGTALLFVEEHQEDIGMIAEWQVNYPKKEGTHYGCFVYGSFYAIELDSLGFDREPRIPV